jgi:hypothetical protein
MPSSPTASLRIEKQFTGENINLWGVLLDTALDLIDAGIAGMSSITVSGNYTLTSTNYVADQARNAILKLTGSVAATGTIPSVTKIYVVWNASSALQIISTGSGTTATIQIGEVALIVCDGVNVKRVLATDYGSQRITSVADPTGAQDAATKAYVDAQAFAAAAGNLPGMPGNAGKFLYTDAASASWRAPVVGDVSGAAPVAEPTFTGGVTVSSGGASITGAVAVTGAVGLTGVLTVTGGSVGNVTALGALDINFAASDSHTKSISTNSTFTFSGLVAGKLQAVLLKLTITSAAVPAWPASVKYPDGVNPSAALGNGTHYLGLITADGGTSVLLTVLGRAAA